MQLKRLFVIIFVIFGFPTLLFANQNIGKYSYNIDTVISMMELSLIEEGINPETEEFIESIDSLQLMVSLYGEESLIENIIKQSPFSYIEIEPDNLKIQLLDGEFIVPIEIINDTIYSKDLESLDEILGYFEDNKLYFDFKVTFDVDEQASISKECKPFYLIPFEKEG